MIAYQITARNNTDGNIYSYELRPYGELYDLIGLDDNTLITTNISVGYLIDFIALNHEIIEVHTF